MDFLSDRLAEMKRARGSIGNEDPALKAYCDSAEGIIEALCAEVDILKLKLDEYAELADTLDSHVQQIGAGLQDVHSMIVGDIAVDTDSYTEKYDEGHCHDDHCDCHECGGEAEDEDGNDENSSYATLQCPFCEEIFIVERASLDEYTDCPSCGRNISVKDSLVE